MKVLAYVHAYPPLHNAGAEWMLHSMFRHFLSHNISCSVVSRNLPDGEFEGVKTIRLTRHPYDNDFSQILDLYAQHDIVFTHLDCTGDAIRTHDKMKTKPLYWICHNSHLYPAMKYRTGRYTVVYNTEWLKQKMNYEQDSVLCYPPVETGLFSFDKSMYENEYITLLNCNELKGGQVLVELAKAMPDRKFLGVLGHYGDQIQATLPNLTYINNTPDVREKVYAHSRIVLMPSGYESFGRVAMEAYAAGIPVLAHPTDGLLESMGRGGWFADRSTTEGFCRMIKNLDDKKTYADYAAYGISRAKEIENKATEQLDTLVQHMQIKMQ